MPATAYFEKIFLQGKRPYLWLFVIAVCFFIPCLWFGFSPLDDHWIIVEKFGYISNPDNFRSFFMKDLLGPNVGYYRPLRTIVYMIIAQVGGQSPLFYHLFNILLHGTAVLLVFSLIRKFNVSAGIAFFLSLVFAFHPVAVSSVAWIPALNDAMLAIFVFAAAITYINFLNTKRWFWLYLHLLLYCLAMMTKESSLVLPVILIAFSFLVFESIKIRRLVIPVLSWLALTAAWFLMRQLVVTDLSAIQELNIIKVLQNISVAILAGYGKFIFPLYGNKTTILVFGGAIILLAIVFFVFIKPLNRNIVFFGGLWFLIFLLIPATFKGGYSDTWLYTANLGGLLMLSQINLKIKRKIFQAAMFCLVIAVYGICSQFRLSIYKNELTFANFYISEHPDETIAYFMRGIAYSKSGYYTQSVADLDTVISRRPAFVNAYYNRGISHYKLKNYRQAYEDFNRVISLVPNFPNAYFERGLALMSLKDYDSALSDLTASIQQRPGYFQGYFFRGLSFARLDQNDKAINDFSKVISLKPDYGLAYYHRALGYILQKKYQAGLEDLRISENLYPSNKEVHFFTGLAYLNLLNYTAALKAFERALEVNPDDGRAWYNGGLCYRAMGNQAEADKWFTKAWEKGFQAPERN